VVAEMPGVSKEDVHITVEDDLLTFTAERGEQKLRKEGAGFASCAKSEIEAPAITVSWKSSARSVRNEKPGGGTGAHRAPFSNSKSPRR